MAEYTLTTFEECVEKTDLDYGKDTASIEQYGLRCCGTQAEYDLAIRLQEVRAAALGLINTLCNEGYAVSGEILDLIDVQVEVTTTERRSLDRRG